MKALHLVVGLLAVIGCSRREVAGPVAPVLRTPTPLALDSAGHVAPDSVHAVAGPKTVVVQGKKIKLKRGATLVIQAGSGNQVATQYKPRQTQQATGPGATATDNTRAGYKAQGGVAVGEHASATGSQQTKEASWPWYVWGAIGVGLLAGLWRLKRWLGW